MSAEFFRITQALMEKSSEEEGLAVMVTSTHPAEGKSMIARYLAWTAQLQYGCRLLMSEGKPSYRSSYPTLDPISMQHEPHMQRKEAFDSYVLVAQDLIQDAPLSSDNLDSVDEKSECSAIEEEPFADERTVESYDLVDVVHPGMVSEPSIEETSSKRVASFFHASDPLMKEDEAFGLLGEEPLLTEDKLTIEPFEDDGYASHEDILEYKERPHTEGFVVVPNEHVVQHYKETTFRAFVEHTTVPCIDRLMLENMSENPYVFFSRELPNLRKEYSLILIEVSAFQEKDTDMSPALLRSLFDHTLIVFQPHTTTMEGIQKTVKVLKGADETKCSLVLNNGGSGDEANPGYFLGTALQKPMTQRVLEFAWEQLRRWWQNRTTPSKSNTLAFEIEEKEPAR